MSADVVETISPRGPVVSAATPAPSALGICFGRNAAHRGRHTPFTAPAQSRRNDRGRSMSAETLMNRNRWLARATSVLIGVAQLTVLTAAGSPAHAAPAPPAAPPVRCDMRLRA